MNAPKRLPSAPKHTVQGARVLGRISGRPAVFYHSRKAGGILALESAGERVIAQLAELDPRVKSISPQPFALDVITGKVFTTRRDLKYARNARSSIDALRRDYTPDLLVVLHDGRRIIVEVKDPRHALRDDYRQKLETAQRLLTMRGERFLLIPLQYAESAPLVHNTELLALALAHPLAPDVIRAVSEQIDTLLGSNQMTLRDLMPALNLTLREAPALITAGVLEADLARFVLNGRALVRAANGSLRHLELLPLEEVKP
ncbi:MAG: hypothetical protein PWP11_2624 [Thauera sp.]|jgi:hypothetical protein|nr:TnsA endonuclease N-terminal domain-containing protein [Thauera sp.]MDI3491347.1 hypothetical protein [Thauera sp.]